MQPMQQADMSKLKNMDDPTNALTNIQTNQPLNKPNTKKQMQKSKKWNKQINATNKHVLKTNTINKQTVQI